MHVHSPADFAFNFLNSTVNPLINISNVIYTSSCVFHVVITRIKNLKGMVLLPWLVFILDLVKISIFHVRVDRQHGNLIDLLSEIKVGWKGGSLLFEVIVIIKGVILCETAEQMSLCYFVSVR